MDIKRGLISLSFLFTFSLLTTTLADFEFQFWCLESGGGCLCGCREIRFFEFIFIFVILSFSWLWWRLLWAWGFVGGGACFFACGCVDVFLIFFFSILSNPITIPSIGFDTQFTSNPNLKYEGGVGSCRIIYNPIPNCTYVYN